MSAKQNLQIILITYNRENHLKKTFEQLYCDNSPLKDYDILVLDNNSTDGTQDYVKEMMKSHPNLNYSKNKYNLGISGNIAKAMEIASKEYLWIMADDDNYDWSNWDEVECAMDKGEEVICIARYGLPDEHKDLVEYQVGQLTFVPGAIYKTSYFTDAVIRNAFDNIYTLFPHLATVMTLINEGKKIYVVDKAIVDNGMDVATTDCSFTRGFFNENLSPRSRTMSWIVGYANICSLLKDRKLRIKLLNVGINGIHGSFDKFINDVTNWYLSKDALMQITDLYIQLNSHQRRKLIFVYNVKKIKRNLKGIFKSLKG